MTILFYEGLPGAGKSYEAMATQIIPFLQKGREVVAYIEGLDTVECQQRLAEAAELPLERVQELVFPLTRDDMRPREVQQKKNGKSVTVVIDGAWIDKVRDNAFHVFDEAQNWWPNRLRATDALTQFVTEHRHRGIDVLLMGQSLMDVLALWRRRIDQKFTFLKLTALGTDKRYRVTIWKGQGNDEFVKVSDKLGKYDAKYFGTYKSHVADDTNTSTYTDSRVNAFGTWGLKFGVPLMLGAAIWGGVKAWAFFHPEAKPKEVVTAPAGQAPSTGQGGAVAASKAVAVPSPALDARSPQERHFAALTEKARVRLTGLIEFKGRTSGVIEWMDDSSRVTERLSLDQLRDLGVSVMVTRDVVRLTLGDWVVLATMWPIESDSRVSEAKIASLRGGGDVPGGSSTSTSPAGLTYIDTAKREPVGEIAKQPTRPGARL